MRGIRLFAAVLLALAIASSALAAAAPVMSIRFFSVGQGDSAAVRLPDGGLLLIDSGPPGVDELPARLRGFSRGGLRAVFITHPHADHVAGFPAVLKEFGVSYAFDTGYPHPSDLYEETLTLLLQRGVTYRKPRRGQEVSFGKVGVRFLHPAVDDRTRDPNEASLVFILSFGSFRALFTGDIGAPSEKRLLDRGGSLRAEVLKVAHHGSKGSSSEAFLAAVRPKLAVISVGAGNDYGHPAAETITRLRKCGARVLRTDLSGDITVSTNGRTWSVSTAN